MKLMNCGTTAVLLGVALVASAAPVGASTIVTFKEPSTDGQKIGIDVMLDPGIMRLVPDVATGESGRVELVFPTPFPLTALEAWAVLLEKDSTARSDDVYLKVTPRPTQNDVVALIGFESDGGLTVAFPRPPAVVLAKGVEEDGTVQDLSGAFFRVQNQMAVNVPLICPTCQQPFLTISVQSDVDPIPEPSTMLLMGTGLIGLVKMRVARRKQDY